MSKKKSKSLLFFIILIIIFLIILVTIFTTRKKIKITGNIANINLDNCEKITVSYLDDTKTLDDEIAKKLLNLLNDYDYPIINEYGLIISSDFKIDFQNGIIFNFGQFGTEVEVFLDDNSIIITELPYDILNYIRKIFNQNNNEKNEILNQNLLIVE